MITPKGLSWSVMRFNLRSCKRLLQTPAPTPIELDEAAQAAIDAAKAGSEHNQAPIAPRRERGLRLRGRPRLDRAGPPSARSRRPRNASRSGRRPTGPGAALWGEAETAPRPDARKPHESTLAGEQQELVVAVPQAPRGVAGDRCCLTSSPRPVGSLLTPLHLRLSLSHRRPEREVPPPPHAAPTSPRRGHREDQRRGSRWAWRE